MEETLKKIVRENQQLLEQAGFTASIVDGENQPTGYWVDIDGPKVLGTICYWPRGAGGTYEFHFIEKSSGKDLMLDTKDFEREEELLGHFLLTMDSLK